MLNINPMLNGNSAKKFRRYVGYDDAKAFSDMLTELYIKSRTDGIFIDGTIPNPSIDESQKISSRITLPTGDITLNDIVNNLNSLKLYKLYNADGAAHNLTVNDTAAHIMSVIEKVKLVSKGAGPVKNSYLKMLCWCVRYAKAKQILFIGELTKNETYWLYLMSLLGCEITCVDWGGDEQYKVIDPSGEMSQAIYGRLKVPLKIEFAKINVAQHEQLMKMNNSFTPEILSKVQRLQTTVGELPTDILKSYQTRIVERGDFKTEQSPFTVYFAAMIGYTDRDAYLNILYKLKNELSKSGKQLIFIEKELAKPSMDEGDYFRGVDRSTVRNTIESLALKIQLNGDPTRTALAQKALTDILTELNTQNINVVFNLGTKLITWLYRCTAARKYQINYTEIPVVLYYGDITQAEVTFLFYLSKIGFDVLYISSDTLMLELINQKNTGGEMQVFELPQSMPNGEYPDKPVKMKMATVAYNAERDLDNMLYNGQTGIYRSYQFRNSQARTLKTTFEEIDILWQQEAKFRAGFETVENLVMVPNIFAKISGVKDNNPNEYWDSVRAKLTPETIIYQKMPTNQAVTMGIDYNVCRSYYKGTKIDTDKLKNSPMNKYSFMPDEIQDFILYKIQEAIDCNFLKLQNDELMCMVIHEGMSFDKKLLQMIQKFDFTKAIPKYVIIDTIEETFNKSECIKIVLLNLIGFDVIVYTPTGFKNIESYIDQKAFEIYTMSDFIYDMQVPQFKIPTSNNQNNGGLFGRLFRKGH